jgi:hypothetical protein
MDELGGFEPTDTTGFIQIESIRIKKYVQKAFRELILIFCFVIDGRRRTSAEDRAALSRGMYMALVFEFFHCRVLCKRGSVVQFDSARYVVCGSGGPRPATESQA